MTTAATLPLPAPARRGASSADTPSRLHRGRWLAATILLALASVWVTLAAHRFPQLEGDLEITRMVQATPWGALLPALHFFDALGFIPMADPVYGGTLLLLFLFRRRWEAIAGSLSCLGAAGLSFAVKDWVNRPRPPAALVHVDHSLASPSYPAGHVINFTAFAGFLAVIVLVRMRPSVTRALALLGLVASMALMGLARIRAGEHWPSDVLGGYLLGGTWTCVVALIYDARRGRLATQRSKEQEVT